MEQVVAVRDFERMEIRSWSRSGPQIIPCCILTDVEVLGRAQRQGGTENGWPSLADVAVFLRLQLRGTAGLVGLRLARAP